jgi:hypothetical protein
MSRDEEWRPLAGERLRPDALRALTAPLAERRFTYGEYERFLERIADRSRFAVVPLRELQAAPRDRIVVGLRHDVDARLESALELGRREHRLGVRATYFVLHSAPYYRRDGHLVSALRTLQDEYGHEIGWHNDLVTLQCVGGADAVSYLHEELEWLRSNGLVLTGTAAHGARECYELGYTNRYFFGDFPEIDPALPNRDVVEVDGEAIAVPHAHLADFDLEYEATQLPRDRYFSDATFDARGRRWHPGVLPWHDVRPGEVVVVLTHPCLWDPSARARILRESQRLAARAVRLGLTKARRA